MITYVCEYDLKSETTPMVHVQDSVTVDYPMSEGDLASHLSLTWALVRGETNDLTDLHVIRAKEIA